MSAKRNRNTQKAAPKNETTAVVMPPDTPDQNERIYLEQYKLAYSIVASMNDHGLKGVFALFVAFSAVLAMIASNIKDTPDVKYMFMMNYVLMSVFLYYFWYLRFRIRSLMELIRTIEKSEKFKYSSIDDYNIATHGRLISTKGLFVVVFISLFFINTVMMYFMWS